MLKLLGALLILTSGIFCSRLICEKKKKRLKTINALIELLEHIRSSIQTARLPLNDIYELFNNDALESCGFNYILRTQGLHIALDSIKDIIGTNIYDAVIVTSAKLGGINISEQIGMCNYSINKLQNEHQKEREQFTEKQKLYKALPILCALSVIILIL